MYNVFRGNVVKSTLEDVSLAGSTQMSSSALLANVALQWEHYKNSPDPVLRKRATIQNFIETTNGDWSYS